MPSLVLFAILAGGFTFLWGRSLWYFDERAPLVRSLTFRLLSHTRHPAGTVRTILLSALYYGIGVVASVLFMIAFGLGPGQLVRFSGDQFTLSALGIVAEISLTSLLVAVGMHAFGPPSPARFAEIREVPWIKGLQELPTNWVPVAAACGGMVEELVFRGVFLRILTERLGVAPLTAVFATGGLFLFQQLIQVKTPFQRMVIGSGCVAISVVGGVLVVLTGSVIPAIVCHGSFVLFFLNQGRPNETPRGFGRAEAAR
jgi:membrane protease YdiL (CAAX protease family)